MIQRTTAPELNRSSSKNQNVQSNISALAEKSQLRQQLQTLLLALDRLEVAPRQRNDKYTALMAITMILESQR
ncbi:MAG: hypothetical protein ACXW1Z_19085 [Methylobacter sp.]